MMVVTAVTPLQKHLKAKGKDSVAGLPGIECWLDPELTSCVTWKVTFIYDSDLSVEVMMMIIFSYLAKLLERVNCLIVIKYIEHCLVHLYAKCLLTN